MTDFYDQLADDYDAMVGVDQRSALARNFVRTLRLRLPCESALDVACGTGLYALAFAADGVPTVGGADLSPAMLAVARQQATAQSLDIDWWQVSMQRLGEAVRGTFDLVVCLGNSLPHLLTPQDLQDALSAFHSRLNPGGTLVVQVMNYSRILADQERIVEVNRHGANVFVRFYDFGQPTLRFNVLQLQGVGEGECEHTLVGTDLYPYQRHELAEALIGVGFHGLADFGSLTFEPFEPAASTTLVLTALKAG